MKLINSFLLITCVFFVTGQLSVQAQNELSENQYDRFGIYANTAPRPEEATPVETSLPLSLKPQTSIALIGNTLFERNQNFGTSSRRHTTAIQLRRSYSSHRLVTKTFLQSRQPH
mgnify:CR=1 FL=1